MHPYTGEGNPAHQKQPHGDRDPLRMAQHTGTGAVQIFLLHLSDNTSHEARFVQQVEAVAPGILVLACPKEGVAEC